MTDVFGNELKFGDFVAYSTVNGRSPTLRVGCIAGFKRNKDWQGNLLESSVAITKFLTTVYSSEEKKWVNGLSNGRMVAENRAVRVSEEDVRKVEDGDILIEWVAKTFKS